MYKVLYDKLCILQVQLWKKSIVPVDVDNKHSPKCWNKREVGDKMSMVSGASGTRSNNPGRNEIGGEKYVERQPQLN